MNKIINVEDFTGSYEYRPAISYEMYGWDSHPVQYSTCEFELYFETNSGLWIPAATLEKWKFDWTRITSTKKRLFFITERK